MKTLKMTLVIGLLSITQISQAKIQVPKEFAIKTCELISLNIAGGSNKGYLKKYTVPECLKNAEISINEEYDREYSIHFQDDYIAALKGTDLWLTCSLSLKGAWIAKNIELEDCSIEQ